MNSSLHEQLERATRRTPESLLDESAERAELAESWRSLCHLLEKAHPAGPLSDHTLDTLLASCDVRDPPVSRVTVARKVRSSGRPRLAIGFAVPAAVLLAALGLHFRAEVQHAWRLSTSRDGSATRPLGPESSLPMVVPVAWEDELDRQLEDIEHTLFLVQGDHPEFASRATWARDVLADIDAELEGSSL